MKINQTGVSFQKIEGMGHAASILEFAMVKGVKLFTPNMVGYNYFLGLHIHYSRLKSTMWRNNRVQCLSTQLNLTKQPQITLSNRQFIQLKKWCSQFLPLSTIPPGSFQCFFLLNRSQTANSWFLSLITSPPAPEKPVAPNEAKVQGYLGPSS